MVGSRMKTKRCRTEFFKNYGKVKASLPTHGWNTNARSSERDQFKDSNGHISSRVNATSLALESAA